jgi:hypothetical protein
MSLRSLSEKPPQKLISFFDSKADLDRIQQDIKDGWAIVSLMQNDKCYVGIMEKILNNYQLSEQEQKVYIPPRKKLKFLAN